MVTRLHPKHSRRTICTSLLLSIAAFGLTACSSPSPPRLQTTAIFALPVNTQPNYIFPLDSLQYYTFANVGTFQLLMYRPLYWFSNDGKVAFNPRESLADAPTYSNGGRTVTILLKHWLWSDGKPITSRDIQFWLNLLLAEKTVWASYVPGAFPANLVSEAYPNERTVTLTFNRAYSQHWLLFNELSQIFPIPQFLWDKTSLAGPVGNYDETPTGAADVYKFLNRQAQQLGTYTTNPLWQVVDGPWELHAFDGSTGYTVFVRNRQYSGPSSGTVTRFVLQPYASATSESAALLSHSVDYGYIPPASTALIPKLDNLGYTVQGWQTWSIAYMSLNFLNPTIGAAFKQLYVRQALQDIVNQPQYIKTAFKGFAYPTYGPIPLRPPSDYLSTAEQTNPYPYSPAKARGLLQAHGWVMAAGLESCRRPGRGAADCGPGVPAGAQLAFTLAYASGNGPLAVEVQLFASAAARIGIDVTLHSAPISDLLAADEPCGATSGISCGWQASNCGGCFWTYYPDFYPTGGEIFGPGASSNQGSYANATAAKLIQETHLSSSLASLHQYENFLARQLPVLWMPTPDYQISVISNRLRGALPQDPLAYVYPEDWSLASA